MGAGRQRTAHSCSNSISAFSAIVAGAKIDIAWARKSLGVIYDTLRNNWVFEDFPNFVLAS